MYDSRLSPFREIHLRSAGRPSPVPELASRLPVFLNSHGEDEKTLRGLRILVCGTGAVGWTVALELARLQPAELRLVDPKSFKAASLITHGIAPSRIGRSKAMAAGRACKRLSPATRVLVFHGRAEELPPTAWLGVDLVVMATDNLAAEDAIGQRLLQMGIPLIHAAVFGPSLTAQVRFYANEDGTGPCPVCGFGEMERRQLAEQVRYSCEGHAAGSGKTEHVEEPTRSTSSLCGIAASLAMQQLLRHSLKLGQPVTDTLIDYCAYTHEIVTSPLRRNPRCLKEHARFDIVRAPGPLADSTLRGLCERIGLAAKVDGLTFSVDEAAWVERGACRCSPDKPVHRFMGAPGGRPRRCGVCGEPILPQPYHTYSRATASLLGNALIVPLRRLGAARARWVLVRFQDKTTLMLNPLAS